MKRIIIIMLIGILIINACSNQQIKEEENKCKLFGYYTNYLSKKDIREFYYQKDYIIGFSKVDAYADTEGDSMYPNIKDKDILFLIKYKNESQLHICDVIAFKNDRMSSYNLHRITDIREDYLITKGDYNIIINEVNGERINETNFENFGYEKVYYQNITHIAVGLLR